MQGPAVILHVQAEATAQVWQIPTTLTPQLCVLKNKGAKPLGQKGLGDFRTVRLSPGSGMTEGTLRNLLWELLLRL